MRHSRNWFPFKNWLRQQLLFILNRYLRVPEEPRKHHALFKISNPYDRARKMKRCLTNRID